MREPTRGTAAAMVRRKLQTEQDRLQNFAEMMQGVLANKCANYEPTVKCVRVKKRPQLMFELFIRAESEEDAVRKARHWILRALTARRKHNPAIDAVKFPYGHTEVTEG